MTAPRPMPPPLAIREPPRRRSSTLELTFDLFKRMMSVAELPVGGILSVTRSNNSAACTGPPDTGLSKAVDYGVHEEEMGVSVLQARDERPVPPERPADSECCQ